ncbi:MAG: hypothetical protein KA712_09740 [Myxococcales bacterium]|nr:hypothetical protein [Myxococcales bacterium]
MRGLRLILAAAAAAYSVSQFWTERRKLARVRNMPVRQAIAEHERDRHDAQRTLYLVTALVCTVALGLAVYAFGVLPPPRVQGAP